MTADEAVDILAGDTSGDRRQAIEVLAEMIGEEWDLKADLGAAATYLVDAGLSQSDVDEILDFAGR
jgi:hypothetical protein